VALVVGIIAYRVKRKSRKQLPPRMSVNFDATDCLPIPPQASESGLFVAAPLSGGSKKARAESRKATIAKNKQSIWEDLIDADSPPSPHPAASSSSSIPDSAPASASAAASTSIDLAAVQEMPQTPVSETSSEETSSARTRRYPTYNLHHNTIFNKGPLIEEPRDNPIYDPESKEGADKEEEEEDY
jgi:hypothetical protein